MKNAILAIVEFTFRFLAAIFALGVITMPIKMFMTSTPLSIVILAIMIEMSIGGLISYALWALGNKIAKI